jgi:hypothetical protein
MTHSIQIIPGLPCPACGGGMFLRQPHQRSAECAVCGYSRQVRKYPRLDGTIEVQFGKPPKTRRIEFRVPEHVWLAMGGHAASSNSRELVLDLVAKRGKM